MHCKCSGKQQNSKVFGPRLQWTNKSQALDSKHFRLSFGVSNLVLKNFLSGKQGLATTALLAGRMHHAATLQMTHFIEESSMQPFLDMDVKVLPHATAWMGICGEDSCSEEGDGDEPVSGQMMKMPLGSTMMYRFVRAIPTLLGGPTVPKKRKRSV